MNEETKENKKQNFLFHDTVISWACIIWAVASIGLMVYFSGLDQVTFTIMTFGQLFLIMGIIAITRKQATGGIFTVTGLGCIIIPAINEWGYLFYNRTAPDNMFPIFTTLAIILVGFGMLVLPGILENMDERRCKKTVKAECVDFKETKLRDGITVFAPIYSYSYEGQVYTACKERYSKEKLVTIGSTIDLRINENKPNDVYFGTSKASKMLTYIFGVCFVITGIGMMFTIFSEI